MIKMNTRISIDVDKYLLAETRNINLSRLGSRLIEKYLVPKNENKRTVDLRRELVTLNNTLLAVKETNDKKSEKKLMEAIAVKEEALLTAIVQQYKEEEQRYEEAKMRTQSVRESSMLEEVFK